MIITKALAIDKKKRKKRRRFVQEF